MSRVHYQRVPRQPEAVKRLHAHARRILPKGSHIVDISTMRSLGGGDLEAGEAVLHRMFKMAAPGAVHPDALRELGAGSIVKGRRVLQKFLDRTHDQYTETENAKLPANQENEPEAEHEADGGKVFYERVPLAKLVWQPDGNGGRAL